MILLEELQVLWKQLKTPIRGERSEGVELHQIGLSYGSPLLTIDDFERRHLLVPIPSDLATENDTISGGIHVTNERWGISNQSAVYVDVVCLKPYLSDLFNLVILDVLEECEAHPAHPDRSAHRVLERWRDFIQGQSAKAPNRRETIGLLGELWFLRELSRQRPIALDAWKGPLGERYDFYTGITAVEVKTSQQLSRRSAVINGHMQLEQPPNGALYFLHLQLEAAPSAKESLESILSDLIELGCDQRRLLTALARIGFTPDVFKQVSKFRVNIIHTNLYLVNESFPRIVAASFAIGDLPAHVNEIRYRIDLNGISPLTPSEYENFLPQFLGELSDATLP